MKSFILALLLIPNFILAQLVTDDYRSATNPYYWKNRKPHDGYWQQDVHYKLKARVNDSTDIVNGEEELTYCNNSPHEINYVFFHLYNNAQTKDSYLSDLYRNNNMPLKYGKYRKQNLGTQVAHVTQDGNNLKTELDNTILKVFLDKALKPNECVKLHLNFTTYFDKEAIRNRMKLFTVQGYKHYDLVHWYPRIAVYDAKFGWETDQHMDHEFYGDFGSFEVELTLPNQYILDGTGVLTNEREVLPEDLRQKLDISNFKTKPWNSAPSEIIKPDGSFKTWKFYATNVHDVAYTFDPTYRIGEARWENVRCIALVQEPHAAGWLNAADYIAKIIETNSKNIGRFAYPKMIAADAQDGMEYPMLTLDGGFDPNYRGLFIHEISHNWFFGMLGSNETYRAFMDEGFTQFYTTDTWEKIESIYDIRPKSKSAYVEHYAHPVKYRESNAIMGYYNSVARGEEVTLNTHSDGFNGGIRHGGGYGQVYSKTATMLYNLKYVLGDSLFEKAMQHYFNQWKMCHPYPEDFRNSITDYTQVDLNWFFDQWLETTKTIDYAVKKIKRINRNNDYQITFKRKGSMQMPLDFTVYAKDSAEKSFHIPNTWFTKSTKATVLPKWIGWDKVKKTYTAQVHIPGGIERVVIDTTNRLADINMANNSSKKNVKFNFDSKIWNITDRTHYEVFVRPSLWYNGYDGVKAGAYASGSYLNYKHVFESNIWFNTILGQSQLDKTASANGNDIVSVLVNYRTSTEKFMKKSAFLASIRELDGLSALMLGFEKKSNNDKDKLTVYVKSMLRDFDNDLNYLIYKNEWQTGKLNNYLAFLFEHNYNYVAGNGLISLGLKAPALYSDYNYSYVHLSCVNKNNLGKININTRFYMQLGTGTEIPNESQLFVAGANPEELMDNKYTRSMGIFSPFTFGNTTNHFAAGGGLNLRGYMGYLLPLTDAFGNYSFYYKGISGTSFNTEIEFGKLLGIKKAFVKNTYLITPYLFGDAGIINTNLPGKKLKFSDLLADAGLGINIGIQRWWVLETAKPLNIRFDFPLFINRLPYEENNHLQFRWMIGVNRAF